LANHRPHVEGQGVRAVPPIGADFNEHHPVAPCERTLMFYCMTFADENEDWDVGDHYAHEAATPFDAVQKAWGHCWLNDPGTDPERIQAWLEGEPDGAKAFHVISLDGSQWLVAFEVHPVGFDAAKRCIVWEMRHVETAPHEQADRHRAKWIWVTAEHAAAERAADELSNADEGWWIDHFCDGEPCADCAKLDASILVTTEAKRRDDLVRAGGFHQANDVAQDATTARPDDSDEKDRYWRDAMSRRMDTWEETTRLCTVLRGFFVYDSERFPDLINFWQHASRPYGNKSVEESIAYNLGWDWQRRLCTSPMPAWVEKEALHLHQLVGERLKDERS
jgi:hypothetical protein